MTKKKTPLEYKREIEYIKSKSETNILFGLFKRVHIEYKED